MATRSSDSWFHQIIKPELRELVASNGADGGAGYVDFIARGITQKASSKRTVAQTLMESGAFVFAYEWLMRPTFVRIFGGPHNGMPSLDGEFAVHRGLLGLGRRPRGVWLDLSCGAGFSTRAMLRAVPDDFHVGLDISEAMLTSASRVLRQENTPNLRLVRADVYDMPFSDDSFDGINNAGSAQLYQDEEAAFREIHRVLKPGGVYVMSTMAESDRALGKMFAKWTGVRRTRLDGFEQRLADLGFSDFSIIEFGDIFVTRVVKAGSPAASTAPLAAS